MSSYIDRLRAVADLRTSARQPKDHKKPPAKAVDAKEIKHERN